MKNIYHATPYNINATGFYFSDYDDYSQKAVKHTDCYGEAVDEYEIQCIDGDDYELFEAYSVNQANLEEYLKFADEADDHDKLKAILAGRLGYDVSDDLEIDIYELDTLEDLAEQFVEEGLFGVIPENIAYYIDYSKIANDLACDYSMENVCNTNYAVRVA